MTYCLEDTICAISTPPGFGAIGIIRISGTSSLKIINSIFKTHSGQQHSSITPNIATLGIIEANNQLIDEVVLTYFKKPKSYTGEDLIEISAHGSPVVLNRILNTCVSLGARPAEPGEFSFRAFVNGKIDITKAEAVSDLIKSKTVLAAGISAKQMFGGLSLKISEFKQKLTDLISKLEVTLDHSEEDIEFISKEEILKTLDSLLSDINKIHQAAAKSRYLREGVKITIVGKPNAGKSSILNCLLELDRAIVSDVAGTTRDIISETLDIKGIPVIISDTAGLRQDSTDKIEKIGIEKALNHIIASDLVLWVIDSSGPISTEDNHIKEILKENKLKTLCLINKTDLPAKISESELVSLCDNYEKIHVSAKTRVGFEKIESAIIKQFESGHMFSEENFLVNSRHTDTLNRALVSISAAVESLNNNESHDLVVFNVRETLNIIGEISGETLNEDILDLIFSKFCIGK